MNYLVAVDDFFPDRPGGMARVAWEIGLAMRDRGHRVAFVCLSHSPGRYPVLEVRDGIQVLRVIKPELPSWHPARLHRCIAAVAERTRQILGRERWDTIHTHSLQTGVGVHEAFGLGPRYVATVHSPAVAEQDIIWSNGGWVGRLKLLFGRAIIARVERRLLDQSSVIHTLSRFTADHLIRQHRVQKVTVVPFWVSCVRRRRLSRVAARRLLGWPEEGKLIFTVRNLNPRNGIDLAVRALAPLVADRRCRFLVGGDGPFRGEYEQLARALVAGDGIRFLGVLSEDDLDLAYQAADVFLLPTRALECFGIIIIEALAYGCPVLASDAGAIPEVMEPILRDFIFPAGDVSAMRRATSMFLDGQLTPPPEDRLAVHVASLYGAEVIVPRLASFLEADQPPLHQLRVGTR